MSTLKELIVKRENTRLELERALEDINNKLAELCKVNNFPGIRITIESETKNIKTYLYDNQYRAWHDVSLPEMINVLTEALHIINSKVESECK